MKAMLSAILMMICCLYSGVNWARSNFGFYFGAPLYPYPYYRDPFYYPYYPPNVITIPAAPPVYIQQPPPTIQQYPHGYWYYCRPLEGYYPYIKECPGGWQQVEPIPPSPR
ncbi:hypothetical protein [Candidatus Methylobacter oryzae]|uniref:Uncharacterized protein n=1 Tax=Candidatus Methylobacter oryzae TaxID=2497749 RepID=A0ABY3CCP6_9GAMM|nr:hypothetical protein [Candidatus Methylobacter oryzae]TRW94224.1 hypothetical protein EKO24_012300 [Candidatus Methylobacter oryzae]